MKIKQYRIGRITDMGVSWERWWDGEPPAVRGDWTIETREINETRRLDR